MASVTVERTLDAAPAAVRELLEDVGPFVRACGFDDVAVDGDRVHIENRVGLITIEMTVRVVDREGAAFAYEHVEGPFAEMETRYELAELEDGTRITAATTFALDVGLLGQVMDATLVKRQRRRELEAQFDWLEERLA